MLSPHRFTPSCYSLRSISEEEQRKMRLIMAQHYRAFIWEPSHGGQAYNYTMHSLFK